jgi:flagellar basal-body rod protein FlgF
MAAVMPYGLYISAEGAQVQSQRMDVIANNLANVNTPGFKRDYATFQARYAEAIEQGLQPSGVGGVEDVGGGVKMIDAPTDFSPGKFRTTGQPTDLSIVGDGFFQVSRNGQKLLTRAGDFTINADGVFTTPNGFPVLDSSGSSVSIDPEAGPWTISPDGSVEQDGVLTELALVRPQSLGDLAKAGDNLFSPLATVLPVPTDARRVQSGVLEMSGVNPTSAMMELIETSRAIEANMQLIQNQDHMLGSLISRVLQG